MVEIANGAYKLELTTTDLNTNGVFELGCSISGSTSPPTVYDVIGTLSYGLTVDNDVATPSSFWAEPKAGAAAASYGELLNNMLPVSTGDISTLIGTPAQGDIATDILNVSRRQTAVTSGTAQAGGVTTITLAAGDFATSQIIKNGTLAIVGGTGAGQSAAINSYDGSTKIATITCLNSSNGQWVIYPNNTSIYVVYAASKR